VAHEHFRVELFVTAEVGETRDGMLLGGTQRIGGPRRETDAARWGAFKAVTSGPEE